MADYAAKPTKAKEDVAIIDLRKRMLTMFLNRCRKMRDVREDGVWWRFLDPNASWVSPKGKRPPRISNQRSVERGPAFPSRGINTKKHHESPAPGSFQSNSRTSMAPCPIKFGQTPICFSNEFIGYANVPSAAIFHGL